MALPPLDPATPLVDVTFVVLDLETTGPSPDGCAITEVGALKFRGGTCLGTFQTLIDPGMAIPSEIVHLTGITQAMVAPAPTIDGVLPAFSEFIGNAVIVGHNIRFDLGFLRANLARLGYPPLPNLAVDTLALARRLARDDVEDHKLATLARHYGTATDPCHRALDDAGATAELFHRFLEQVGTVGVTSLDDLLAYPTAAAHPSAAKLRWVAALPRRPGVYVFRDVAGAVLYVGRARDLRRRIRSYFTGVERRRTMPLLREASSLDHVECGSDLEAAVLELRLVHRHRPRYNPQTRRLGQMRYLRLDSRGARSKPVVVRQTTAGDGCRYAGPFASPAAARAARDGDGSGGLGRVLRRQDRAAALITAGRLEIEVDGEVVAVEDGRLATSRCDVDPSGPPAEEAALLAAWLDQSAGRCRLRFVEHDWALPLAQPPAGAPPDPTSPGRMFPAAKS